MSSPVRIRPMMPTDWPAVRDIYQQGIDTGLATFETRSPEWEQWDQGHLAFGRLIADVVGSTAGWAALSPVSRREVYHGVTEVSVYVAARFRGQGVGRALLASLILESEAHGIWTLQAAMFPENQATIRLHRAAGFREVGRREKIGQLRGAWRDTVLYERRSAHVGTGVASR
jgi:phosphinothricin acetyltransferase